MHIRMDDPLVLARPPLRGTARRIRGDYLGCHGEPLPAPNCPSLTILKRALIRFED
jgi:hypothetical protein